MEGIFVGVSSRLVFGIVALQPPSIIRPARTIERQEKNLVMVIHNYRVLLLWAEKKQRKAEFSLNSTKLYTSSCQSIGYFCYQPLHDSKPDAAR
jgi:hypothetical protein